MVIYKHSRVFNVPLKFAYEWCTDYRSGDGKMIGSKFPRIILEKTRKRAVYAGFKKGKDGKPKLAVRVVTLHPRTYSWHLDYFGEEDLEVGDYMLTRAGENKTRLNMTFNNKWKQGEGSIKRKIRSSRQGSLGQIHPSS